MMQKWQDLKTEQTIAANKLSFPSAIKRSYICKMLARGK